MCCSDAKDTSEDEIDPPDGAKALEGHQKIEGESSRSRAARLRTGPQGLTQPPMRKKVVHFGCLLI